MTIEVVSFLVGSLFILIALLGGGIEVKELKVPPVGMAKRVAALVAGMMFVGLGLIPAAWHALKAVAEAADQPAYTVAQTDTTAAAASESSVGSVASSFTADGEITTAPTDTSMASAGWPSAPVAENTGFGGFTGSSMLTWHVGEVRLSGVTYMNGQTGVIRITFTDVDGAEQSVDEDLQLQESDGRIWYVGSNPRYAGTNTAYPLYSPDSFEVVASSDGGWTFSQTCDKSGCNEVGVSPAN